MEPCVVCRRRPRRVSCGTLVYVTGHCPVCLEDCSPIIALPCGHVLCPDDFATLGGRLVVADGTGPVGSSPLGAVQQAQAGSVGAPPEEARPHGHASMPPGRRRRRAMHEATQVRRPSLGPERLFPQGEVIRFNSSPLSSIGPGSHNTSGEGGAASSSSGSLSAVIRWLGERSAAPWAQRSSSGALLVLCGRHAEGLQLADRRLGPVAPGSPAFFVGWRHQPGLHERALGPGFRELLGGTGDSFAVVHEDSGFWLLALSHGVGLVRDDLARRLAYDDLERLLPGDRILLDVESPEGEVAGGELYWSFSLWAGAQEEEEEVLDWEVAVTRSLEQTAPPGSIGPARVLLAREMTGEDNNPRIRREAARPYGLPRRLHLRGEQQLQVALDWTEPEPHPEARTRTPSPLTGAPPRPDVQAVASRSPPPHLPVEVPVSVGGASASSAGGAFAGPGVPEGRRRGAPEAARRAAWELPQRYALPLSWTPGRPVVVLTSDGRGRVLDGARVDRGLAAASLPAPPEPPWRLVLGQPAAAAPWAAGSSRTPADKEAIGHKGRHLLLAAFGGS